ncbi:unnamed protein product [Mucor fragilis]
MRQRNTVESQTDESVAQEQPSTSAPIIEDDVEKFIGLLQNKSPIPQAGTADERLESLLPTKSLSISLVESDPQFAYTMGPPEMVLAFFEEDVLKRTISKMFPIDAADVMIKTALQGEEGTIEQTQLIRRTRKVLNVPIGVEAVKKFKKKSIAKLHEYQKGARNIPYTSPHNMRDLTVLMPMPKN